MPSSGQEPFAQLRWILAQDPSPQSFAQIFALFDAWDDPETMPLGLSYAEAHLQAWEDASRSLKVSQYWPSYPHGTPPPQVALVRTLDLNDKKKGLPLLGSILETPYSQHLTALYAPRCALDTEAIAALSTTPHLHNLRILDLSENDLDDYSIEVLTRSPYLKQLQTLRLQNNWLNSESAVHIANAPHLQGLSVLDLSRNCLDEWGIKSIANSPYMANLTALYLAENSIVPGYYFPSPINDACAIALAESPYMAKLDTLDLHGNHVGRKGEKALATSKYLSISVRYTYIKAINDARQ